MLSHAPPQPARPQSLPPTSLRTPRPFGAPRAAEISRPGPAAGFDFGAVAVGTPRVAPAGAPIQRMLRQRGGGGGGGDEEEEEPSRPPPSLSTRVSNLAAAHVANAQQQPSTLLPYGASAVSSVAHAVAGDNPVSAVINVGTTASSIGNDVSRGAAELGNGEYRNAALSGGSAASRFFGWLGGLAGIPGSGAAASGAAAGLGAAKKKQHDE